ncbi:hypothetical protein E2C01_077763 [Portunus trituberculatus]|uniref:Uncharacterized protein n=1 Tax=Portunus trituberculatus TaxID=210409 RepID=A0A5B7IL16_PORTR|nr:hypothetical protein [Portunus trituberculatus]
MCSPTFPPSPHSHPDSSAVARGVGTLAPCLDFLRHSTVSCTKAIASLLRHSVFVVMCVVPWRTSATLTGAGKEWLGMQTRRTGREGREGEVIKCPLRGEGEGGVEVSRQTAS